MQSPQYNSASVPIRLVNVMYLGMYDGEKKQSEDKRMLACHVTYNI